MAGSRKRTRPARTAASSSSGLATAAVTAAYLACRGRSADAFAPRPEPTAFTFGGSGSSGSRSHEQRRSVALRMVASRPRIGEDILIGSGNELNQRQVSRPPRRTSNAAKANARSRRRSPSNRTNADKNQRHHHKQRGNLPLLLDEDPASRALHEEMAPILRRFDDVSHQLANVGSAAARVESTTSRSSSSGGEAAITQTAMGVLSRAVHVLDAHMTMAIDEESSLDLVSEHEQHEQQHEQEERTVRAEWAVHYASRIVMSYLAIERHLHPDSLDLGPDDPNLGSDGDNDPLHQANALLQRLEAFCAATTSTSNNGSSQPILLPWMDTAGSVLSTSHLRERIYNAVIGAYARRAKVVGLSLIHI